MTNVSPLNRLQAHPEKYGHVERERRYLLSHWPPGLTPQSEHRRITDHYLVGTGLRLRRVHRPATGECLWKLTQKVRASPTDGTRILYPLDLGGRCYGVDVFGGALAGLILAETECGSDEELEGLTLPDFAVHDVSREEVFTGAALAFLTPEEGQALVKKSQEL